MSHIIHANIPKIILVQGILQLFIYTILFIFFIYFNLYFKITIKVNYCLLIAKFKNTDVILNKCSVFMPMKSQKFE